MKSKFEKYPGRAYRALFAGILILAAGNARAALLAYEPFTNAPGTAIIGSSSGLGFNGAWQANSSQGTTTNTGYALGYTDVAGNSLLTVGGAGFFQGSTSASAAMQPIRLFNSGRGTNGVDGVTTWISFLIARQGSIGTLPGNPYGRGANLPHDIDAGAIQKLAIGNSSGATSNTVGLIPTGSGANLKGSTNAFGGVTSFVVVRIDHVAGAANDNAYLFVNPTLGVEPPLAAAGATSLNGFDFSFDRLRVFAGGQNGAAQPYAELVVDEYRIGETYADVTPFTNAGPPVVTGPLLITNAFFVPAGIVLSGKGGSNSALYFILATTNLSATLTNWLSVATNTFDAAGNFIATNPTAPGTPQQFFRLRSGNLAAAPLDPPSISTQPTNRTVLGGQSATFIAAASGTSLNYQWFFNTNTALTSATNSSLTITNAQTANAGGYSLRVTNSAGSVTSVTATLTVNIPPSITTQPVTRTVIISSNETFTVVAAGTATLQYQWYFNTNTPLLNATNASLTIVNAQTNNTGDYSVVVTNSAGSVTSAVVLLNVVASVPAANYYISPLGSDANSGTTVTSPWYSLSKATAVANPGNLIYLRGGIYNYTSRIQITRSGSAAAPIRLQAYPGESPELNYSGQSSGSSSRGIELSGSYWQLYRLEISFAGDNGIWINGKSNLVEFCVFHDCEDSGLQLANAGTAYNVILNCDSYRNYDPAAFGQNADGFAAKFTLGPGNVFGGCRSWENSDDGWDFWETAYQIVMTNCWTWRNGYDVFGVGPSFDGNGNGFKLGGNYIYGPHYIANCLSFSNRVNGFDQNNNNAGQAMDNCTSVFNGSRNFHMNHGTNITAHVIRNCVSFTGGSADSFRSGSLLTSNSWQVVTSPGVNVGDFQSVTGSLQISPRQADGSLPVTPFMRPVPGGRLIDQGVDVGKPYAGPAPDLGAFEDGL